MAQCFSPVSRGEIVTPSTADVEAARLEFFGRVDNLLDEDYEEVFSVQSPGIGVFGGVRVNFGLR